MSEIWGVKYRPVRLSQVLGQEVPKKLIFGALKSREKPDTWLLHGQYGSGKTSIARILGRSLVCISPTPAGESCDQCSECLDVLANENQSLNYVELDSASWGNVEDVRDVLQDARLAPTGGASRRVVVFDEAHLLSGKAQASLLKVFEEGLGQTIFILVTTHSDKIIPTIRSRCINIGITSVDRKSVLVHLRDIVQQEGVDFDEEALDLIVGQTYGHIRNTLNLAYQVSLSGPIKTDIVKKQLNLHIEDIGALLIYRLGDPWDRTLEQVNDLYQEFSPTDLWEAARKILVQAYLCYLSPVSNSSDLVRKISERYGPRLSDLAKWVLGDGARLQIDFQIDLIASLAFVREKLGVGTAAASMGKGPKLGPSKQDLQVGGGIRQYTPLLEERIVSIMGLNLIRTEDKEKNGQTSS
jgi:DNA polymerase III subunit gamma/tau